MSYDTSMNQPSLFEKSGMLKNLLCLCLISLIIYGNVSKVIFKKPKQVRQSPRVESFESVNAENARATQQIQMWGELFNLLGPSDRRSPSAEELDHRADMERYEQEREDYRKQQQQDREAEADRYRQSQQENGY